MLSKKTRIVTHLLLFSMLLFSVFSVVTTFSVAQEATRTEKEVIDIALNDTEIGDWVDKNGAELDHISYSAGTWNIQFLDISSHQSTTLVVIIDDLSGEIVEYFYDVDFIPNSDSVVADAIDFVKHHEMFSPFLTKYPDIDLFGYHYDEHISVYGYHWQNGNYSGEYVTISIRLEMIKNEPYFEIIQVSANDYFGAPKHDFEQILSVVAQNEEVIKFTTEYPNTTLSTTLTYNMDSEDPSTPSGYSFQLDWGNQLYYPFYENARSESQDGGVADPSGGTSDETPVERLVVTDTCQNYYSWLRIGIDDETGVIYEIAGTTTAQYTQNEILESVETVSPFKEWLTGFSYSISATFDGYDSWWVNIYSTNSRHWGYAQVSDSNATILSSYIFTPVDATKNEDEIMDIVLNHQQIKDWLDDTIDYDVYTYYNYQGMWWVYLWDPIAHQNYAYMKVNDVTGEIIDIQVFSVPLPDLSLDELYTILRDSTLVEFVQDYPDARLYFNYRSDYWYVYAYSPVILEASIHLVISDKSGQITENTQNTPQTVPIHEKDEILSIVMDTPEYANFTNIHDSYSQSIYYYHGKWSVSFYTYYEDNYEFASLYVSINDTTGDISELSYYDGSYMGCYYGYAEMLTATADLESRGTYQDNDQIGQEREFLLANILVEEERHTSPALSLFAMQTTVFALVVILISIIRKRYKHLS